MISSANIKVLWCVGGAKTGKNIKKQNDQHCRMWQRNEKNK